MQRKVQNMPHERIEHSNLTQATPEVANDFVRNLSRDTLRETLRFLHCVCYIACVRLKTGQ